MQDIGGKEDTELNEEDLSLSSCGLPVESLGHCQSIGNGCFFLAWVLSLTYLAGYDLRPS